MPTWPQQVEEKVEGKLEIVPRRVGSGSFTKQRGMGTISISGRVLSEAHVREREAGRGAAVEEARTLMEKMKMVTVRMAMPAVTMAGRWMVDG